jgi:hypothetical protein
MQIGRIKIGRFILLFLISIAFIAAFYTSIRHRYVFRIIWKKNITLERIISPYAIKTPEKDTANPNQSIINYLTSKGQMKNALEIMELLKREKIPENVPEISLEHWDKSVERMAYYFASKGLTVHKIKKLQENGINILRTVMSPYHASFVEKLVAEELTIIGEIKDKYDTPYSNDQYHSCMVITVKEVLFGKCDENEIVIRLITGPLGKDLIIDCPDELKPKMGDVYLFILNHGEYKPSIEYPGNKQAEAQGKLPPINMNSYYIKHGAYQIIDGKLEIYHDNPFEKEHDSLEKIFSDIRKADKIVKKLKKTDKNWEK